VHAVIQVPPDGVVGSRDCRCHSFAACTVDVTVCFSRQTVSVLTSGRSRYSAQPTLIVSCLFWSGNYLLAYFLPPQSPIVSFAAMGFFCHSDTSLA